MQATQLQCCTCSGNLELQKVMLFCVWHYNNHRAKIVFVLAGLHKQAVTGSMSGIVLSGCIVPSTLITGHLGCCNILLSLAVAYILHCQTVARVHGMPV